MKTIAVIVVFVQGSLCFLAGSSVDAQEVPLVVYQGEPLSVGILTIANGPDRPADESVAELSSDSLLHFGDEALYPVVEPHRGSNRDASRRIHFLCRPAESVTIMNPDGTTVTANAELRAPAVHREALNQWWKHYTQYVSRNASHDLYPPEVDQYLTSMLARRLDLKQPSLSPPTYLPGDDVSRAVGFLTGTEAIRLAMQKEALLNSDSREIHADRPLPKAESPPAIEIPEPDENVVVEPIAQVVPQECFYVRFGSFANFVWFRERVDQWGTDLRDFGSSRAIDYHVSERLQNQLELRDTELSKLLGPAVINDVAIIGSDTFVREGASIGILFEAKNNALLSTNLQLQRTRRAVRDENVTLTTVSLTGHDTTASLLSSPDHVVRSYYVVHGDFHLITTSRTIARRFLDAAANQQEALGATREFRYARTVTPLERDDSAFVYLSDAFFRTFVDPATRIEMTRRARSENEIQLVQFAQLAARAEGQPADSIESLIDGGFLPFGFARRWDGSQLWIVNGEIIDTLRGARGSFLPVRDIDVNGATVSEVNAYVEFAQTYRRMWTAMDPASVALSRRREDDRERLIMDLHVYPFPLQEFGVLQFLRPETNSTTLTRPADVMMLAEARIIGFQPLFTGLLDRSIPFEVQGSEVITVDAYSEEAGLFFGGWNLDNVRRWLGTDPENIPADEPGELEGHWFYGGKDTWGQIGDDHVVIAGNAEDVSAVVDRLNRVDAERPAQYRIHFGDLANAKGAVYGHAQAWSHASRMSRGNSTFLNHLASQFHIPPTLAVSVADELILGTPVCPLGGEYQLRKNAGAAGSKSWASTKASTNWQSWRLPILERTHGAEFELTAEGTTLTTHVELLMDAGDEDTRSSDEGSVPDQRP